MRSSTALVFFSLALSSCAFAAAGCSNDTGGEHPYANGETGRLRFEYWQTICTKDCTLDRPALQGSRVEIVARARGDLRVPYAATISSSEIGTITREIFYCACDRGAASRQVETEEECLPDETRECKLHVDVHAVKAGDVVISVLDPQERLVDRTTLQIRPADRLRLHVFEGEAELAPREGVYVVPRATSLMLGWDVLDAKGVPLVYSRDAISCTYSDEGVVGRATLLGPIDDEHLRTVTPGQATIAVRATDAESTATFRVTE
jgi:hypothetical protein